MHVNHNNAPCFNKYQRVNLSRESSRKLSDVRIKHADQILIEIYKTKQLAHWDGGWGVRDGICPSTFFTKKTHTHINVIKAWNLKYMDYYIMVANSGCYMLV